MTTKPNPLKTHPPKAPAGEDLAKLEALDEWTKAPAEAAAAAIEPRQRGARAPKGMPGDLMPTPKQKKPAKARKTAPASEHARPWMALLTEEGAAPIKLMNFKCPIELFAQTRWLAQTTYGYTMTRIIIEALQEKNAKMLKDREAG